MAVTLIDVLVPYESRKGILQHLCAWDVAKLDYCLGRVLDNQERDAYLNPMRDIFSHIAELESLLKGGMKLVLLGNDVSKFHGRLKDPGRYTRRATRSRRLHIYLLGMFPVELENQDLLDRMIEFSVSEDPHPARVNYDKRAFKAIQSQRSHGTFLISFGVPIYQGRIEDQGFWYPCQGTPDRSINLKVYVPCFRDGILGEANLRPSELSRVSGHHPSFCKLRTLWVFLCVYIQRYSLESAICLSVGKEGGGGGVS
ncbi:hypothetical protein BU26DRAFT_432860 [Trematosphaeria pertusa]|uniref:Uncharacterized protein n=1 Tax=Trematosphaeria pertusa TaxID=390896 RepID=A0A6A6I795_9PLEO|nr:uncharacterized protein BU26DRAFT_432860 [Trematosphaeria pertusa]KAF2245403.1 hypothetical protein BU26DRAFT_432860 [Trematosphaeria pertusa]